MRVTAVALVAAGDPAEAAGLARRSARVTHTHPLALDGAAIQAAATAVLLETPPSDEVIPEQLIAVLHDVVTTGEHHIALERAAGLCRAGATADAVVRTIGTGVAAVEAVPAALLSFLQNRSSFDGAVRFAAGVVPHEHQPVLLHDGPHP
jgi:poly(ADP-ribose) glycohydrolase ARH3